MITVKTHPLHKFEDEIFTLAIIAARFEDKLVFVRRHGSVTWEMPGGHREGNENILDTAKRELYEETGASQYRIAPVCAYTVDEDGYDRLYGVLFVADIVKLGTKPESEIEEIRLFNDIPSELTFPNIQAKLSVISLPHELFDGLGKDITMRHAQYIDVEDICELHRPEFISTGDEDTDEVICLEQEFRMRTTEHLLRTTIGKPGHLVFIAYDNILPVGVCRIRLMSRPGSNSGEYVGGEIESLMLAKSNERSAVGNHITDCVVKYLKSVGCTYALVWIPSSDEELCDIAEANGFSYDGMREMTETGSRLRYRRTLTD